ncbi:hypothetical protein ACFFLM_02625 [Deinococcus oregonensis]|uniref:Uncharacterized protein n=1 Tax=Deinococcus oregonensis TaxID=1805970 RepID=A0ABV6ATQ8_9DEIO
MNRRTIFLSLSTFLTFSSALADHEVQNLKGFRSVCVNALVEIKDKEDENAAELIYNAIADQLEDAGLAVADNPCQNNGSTANRQLNLLYTFSSTPNGGAYLSQLEGWLQQEGKYTRPLVWNDYIYGSPGKAETLNQLAEDLATELTDNFLGNWEDSH